MYSLAAILQQKRYNFLQELGGAQMQMITPSCPENPERNSFLLTKNVALRWGLVKSLNVFLIDRPVIKQPETEMGSSSKSNNLPLDFKFISGLY